MATCTTSATPMNVPPPVGAIPLRAENQQDDSEGTLVQRAQRGDEQAFATLYQLHNKLVYSVCLRMTKDVAEAEDLTQEAFIQAFRNLNSFRGGSAFSTWLYRVAVNTVLMKLRRKSPPVLSLVYRGTRHLSDARLRTRILTSVERLTVLYCVAPSKSCPEDAGRSSICTRLRDTRIARSQNSCNAPSETQNHSSIKRR